MIPARLQMLFKSTPTIGHLSLSNTHKAGFANNHDNINRDNNDYPCLRAAAAPPDCLPCALDIAAASWLLCSGLSSLRLTGVPSGSRTKPPLPSGASPSGSPESGPSPPSRLASFPMTTDPSRSAPPPLLPCADARVQQQCATKKASSLGASVHFRRRAYCL